MDTPVTVPVYVKVTSYSAPGTTFGDVQVNTALEPAVCAQVLTPVSAQLVPVHVLLSAPNISAPITAALVLDLRVSD
jgi:hypothetical protein